MNKNFNNAELRDILRDVKEKQDSQTIKKVADILYESRLMFPAVWDKEPVLDEKGRRMFAPDTRFNFAVAKNNKGDSFIIAFTSKYDFDHWEPRDQFKPVTMKFKEFFPMVIQNKDLKGLLVDPLDVNLPLNIEFLQAIYKSKSSVRLEKTQFKKGEKLTVRKVKDHDLLKQQIAQYGKNTKEIKSIYLVQRVLDNNRAIWMIIMDMDPENEKIFPDMGRALHKYVEGMDIQFMFASNAVCQQVIAQLEPVYVSGEVSHEMS